MRGPINDFAHFLLLAAKSWRWVGGSNIACILKYNAITIYRMAISLAKAGTLRSW